MYLNCLGNSGTIFISQTFFQASGLQQFIYGLNAEERFDDFEILSTSIEILLQIDYFNRIFIASLSLDDHFNQISNLFHLLNTNNIKINPKKSVFYSKSGFYLGHQICGEKVSPNAQVMEILKNTNSRFRGPDFSKLSSVERDLEALTYSLFIFRQFILGYTVGIETHNKCIKWLLGCDDLDPNVTSLKITTKHYNLD